jgi:hypothetical protein
MLISSPNIINVKGPLIFLAGPIQGAPDWHSMAIKIIQRENPEIHIASPKGDYSKIKFVYEKQVDWETHYLRRAARNGVIMFWLAREVEHIPDRAYAQTSRFELGEWKVRAEKGEAKLVIGIEKGFSNERYIRRRFLQDMPEMSIYDNLEDTCKRAVELVDYGL